MGAQCLDFLPYHFLLCSVGDGGILRYQVTPIMPVNVGMLKRCQGLPMWWSTATSPAQDAGQLIKISGIAHGSVCSTSCGQASQMQVIVKIAS